MKKEELMKEIVDEITARTDSPLYTYRAENNYIPVIGEGSLSAKIFFIGEAPGKTEAETGKPFCGRSGKFLSEMISSIGLERKNVYITSVVKDRPQGVAARSERLAHAAARDDSGRLRSRAGGCARRDGPAHRAPLRWGNSRGAVRSNA